MNHPPTSDPWISRSLGDRQRYRLDKRLGAGGMGDVFLAMDTLLGRQVALKLLKDTFVTDQDIRKRFEREVVVCAALKSDNIVQVNDYGVTPEGHPFYVMEYLRGQTLGQLLHHEQRLDVSRTVGIISQVCDGLSLAHEGVTLWRDGATASEQIKVIHRDLKPDNIFLVPTPLGERVKILDFGIAKIRHETNENTDLTTTFIGTIHYTAPEQLRVETDLDGRADIYSLGMILYEMLSGTDPFCLGFNINRINRISGTDWILAHTSKQPQPLRSQPGCSHLKPELEAVVMRCLQKVPDDRFARVDELKQALSAVAIPLSLTYDPIIPPQKITPTSGASIDPTKSSPFTPNNQIIQTIVLTRRWLPALLKIILVMGLGGGLAYWYIPIVRDTVRELANNLLVNLGMKQIAAPDRIATSPSATSPVPRETLDDLEENYLIKINRPIPLAEREKSPLRSLNAPNQVQSLRSTGVVVEANTVLKVLKIDRSPDRNDWIRLVSCSNLDHLSTDKTKSEQGQNPAYQSHYYGWVRKDTLISNLDPNYFPHEAAPSDCPAPPI